MVRDDSGHVIVSANEIARGDTLHIELQDGHVAASVEEDRHHD